MIKNFDIDMCDNENCKDSSNRGLFLLETFYIANFIERFLIRNKQHKELYNTVERKDKITHLVVSIEHDSEDIKLHKDSKVLTCKTTDQYKIIAPLRGEERAEKILDILSKSATKFEKYISQVEQRFEEAINAFRNEGYRNIWIYKKRSKA